MLWKIIPFTVRFDPLGWIWIDRSLFLFIWNFNLFYIKVQKVWKKKTNLKIIMKIIQRQKTHRWHHHYRHLIIWIVMNQQNWTLTAAALCTSEMIRLLNSLTSSHVRPPHPTPPATLAAIGSLCQSIVQCKVQTVAVVGQTVCLYHTPKVVQKRSPRRTPWCWW